jgi:methylmalonyl-CoA mutase
MHQFPKVTREDWLKKALLAAKGKPFDADAALQGRIDGPRAERGRIAPWQIFQRIDHPSPEKALLQARDDLANGADGLILTEASLATVLDDLPLHSFELRNEAGDDGAMAIIACAQHQPIDPARLKIDFGTHDAALARQAASQGFTGPFMRGDGRQAHAAGATDAQEAGVALADAVANLRSLDKLDAAQMACPVSVTLTATQSTFETIAKFRAVRILWREILRHAGLPDTPLILHGETSHLCLATEDAHTNILRIATTAFAAGLGGADSFCALPHSFNQGIANGFARRVARNAQLLLQHESQVWRVSDPAAGAGAIERQTQKMCDEAWATLQKIERGERLTFNSKHSHVAPQIGVTSFKNGVVHSVDVEDRL